MAFFIAGFALWLAAACPAASQESLLWQEPRAKGQEAERPATGEEGVVRAGLEIWFARIRGDLESDAPGFPDTKFSMNGDAGIGNEVLPKVFVDYVPNADFLFRLAIRSLESSGSKTLGKQVDFDGKTFPNGSRVSSDFDAVWVSLEARIPARIDPADSFQGQSVIMFHVLDADFELSGVPGRGRQRYTIEFFEYGVEARAMIGEGAYLGGQMSFAWGFSDGFIGGEIGLKGGYQSKRVAVEGGFRWWGMGGAINDEPDLDLRMRGPYLGATFRF